MIQLGNLYFIKQSFFDLVQDNTLPINKPDDEKGKHGRPAFCAIKINQGDYYWVIPFSHQIEKYQRIYDKNIQRYGRCDIIELSNKVKHNLKSKANRTNIFV